MEDKIFDIVTDLIRDDIRKNEAIDKLLILYSVSKRHLIEQLQEALLLRLEANTDDLSLLLENRLMS